MNTPDYTDWPYSVTVYYSFFRHGPLHKWLRQHIGHGRKLRVRDNPMYNLDANAEWYFRPMQYDIVRSLAPWERKPCDQVRTYYFKDSAAYMMYMLAWTENNS